VNTVYNGEVRVFPERSRPDEVLDESIGGILDKVIDSLVVSKIKSFDRFHIDLGKGFLEFWT